MALVWIVEDDPKIGKLIEMTVNKAGHDTRRLMDAERLEIAMRYDENLPDLLLLDLMLRGKSGFEVLREWKADSGTRDIPIIIISARSTENDKVKGLELGAEDYITKPFGVKELQARIHAALRRIRPREEKLSFGDLVIFTESREIFLSGERIGLTSREYDLLLYLARHHDRAVTRAALLRDVWGYRTEDDASRTVDSHVRTLRSKLGDSQEQPRYIQTVRGTGYRFIAEEI